MRGTVMRGQKAGWTTAILAAGAGLLALQGGAASASDFNVTNLVSDGFVPAATIDSQLINPWGISSSPKGPFWVSDNNAGVSTLYNGAGAKQGLVVSIPSGAGGSGGAATGQVFNGSGGFDVSAGGKTGSSVFVFATEDGTIAGWSPGVSFTQAVNAVDNSAGGAGAVYKGLAIGSSGGSNYLYAANFRGGDIEMYDSSFGLVKTFTDPGVAAGYAPFNVQDIGNALYVTFALQNGAKHDDVAGAGHGYVDVFNLDGTFNRRLVSLGGAVNSPWGLDIAPTGFGSLGGDLLVGNFGDGTISVFNPTTGAALGQVLGFNGKPIVEGDVWGLINGNGAKGGQSNAVYFTAGVKNEAHGLLGQITAVPEPASWALMLVGFGILGAGLRGRRQVRSTPV